MNFIHWWFLELSLNHELGSGFWEQSIRAFCRQQDRIRNWEYLIQLAKQRSRAYLCFLFALFRELVRAWTNVTWFLNNNFLIFWTTLDFLYLIDFLKDFQKGFSRFHRWAFLSGVRCWALTWQIELTSPKRLRNEEQLVNPPPPPRTTWYLSGHLGAAGSIVAAAKSFFAGDKVGTIRCSRLRLSHGRWLIFFFLIKRGNSTSVWLLLGNPLRYPRVFYCYRFIVLMVDIYNEYNGYNEGSSCNIKASSTLPKFTWQRSPPLGPQTFANGLGLFQCLLERVVDFRNREGRILWLQKGGEGGTWTLRATFTSFLSGFRIISGMPWWTNRWLTKLQPRDRPLLPLVFAICPSNPKNGNQQIIIGVVTLYVAGSNCIWGMTKIRFF